MKGRVATLAGAFAMLIAPQLFAAGETVKIVVSGGDLKAPIEITDGRFQVWAGPGTSSNEAQSLNVDWARGAAEPPKGLQIYQVSFATTRRNPTPYVVRYAFDLATNHGFVYIPGKQDPEYRDNVFLILRRVEGQWFHAWTDWEELANPLIAKALAAR